MKNNKLFIAIIFLLAISCKTDPLVSENPSKIECETGKIDFVNQVLPILQSSCATTGCHNASSRKEGVILDTYSNIIKTSGVNAGNANSSELYQVLTGSGEEKMPPSNSGFVLSQTQKNLIKDWINQGAKNIECTNFVDNSCNTANFKFSANVQTLIEASCVSCHSSSSTNGVKLDTYNNIKISVDNGSLLNSIQHVAGTSAMPQGMAKWDDCRITVVSNWINDGALNN